MLRRALLLVCVLLPLHEAHAAAWDMAHNVGYVPLRVGSVWGVKPQSNAQLTLWYRLFPYRQPDVALNYWNAQLNPIEVGVRATVQHDPRERRAIICLKRRMGAFAAAVSLEGLESERELMQLGMAAPAPLAHRWARRFGPRATLNYLEGRASSTGDLLSGVRMGMGVRLWPHALGNYADSLDARGHLEVAVPLPGDPQHRLLVGSRWRRIWDKDNQMLRTGGTLGAWQAGHKYAGMTAPTLSEGLRGYEDRSWYTPSVATFEVSQRVPVSPRAELEWFMVAARTEGDPAAQSPLHRVAGSAVRVHTRVGDTPVTVAYQAAYRMDGTRQPWLHLVTANL